MRPNEARAHALVIVALLCWACSSESHPSRGTGGNAGTGGHSGSGGSAGAAATAGVGGTTAGGASGGGGTAGSGGGCTACQNGDACCAPGCTHETDDDCPVAGGPVVLYTDIVSGPNSGGEGNNG